MEVTLIFLYQPFLVGSAAFIVRKAFIIRITSIIRVAFIII